RRAGRAEARDRQIIGGIDPIGHDLRVQRAGRRDRRSVRRRTRSVRGHRDWWSCRADHPALAYGPALRTVAHIVRFADHLRTEPLMEDEFAARLAQGGAIRARGEDPYPVRFDRTHTLQTVRDTWDDAIEAGTTTDEIVRVAGRALLKRA